MALNRDKLRAEILKRTDATRSDFLGWPPTAWHAAVSWSQAATAYFSDIAYPPLWGMVGPGGVASYPAAAEEAFVAAALALADGWGRLTVDCLPAGFYAYVSSLFLSPYVIAPLPLPGTYWVTTAPLIPIAWPDPDDDDYPKPTVDVYTFADWFSWLVDYWARTGSAFFVPLPPALPTPPAPWS